MPDCVFVLSYCFLIRLQYLVAFSIVFVCFRLPRLISFSNESNNELKLCNVSSDVSQNVVYFQDPDGSHIKGLIVNFLHTYWPSLLKANYVNYFVTPLLKACYFLLKGVV